MIVCTHGNSSERERYGAVASCFACSRARAISLPQAKLEGPAVIDLRSLPPNVAEVYVLTIMQKLQRRCDTHLVLCRPGVAACIASVPGTHCPAPQHVSQTLPT